MRKIVVCFLLAFILFPAAYGQKNKTGIAVAEGITKDASVVVRETVGISARSYGQYVAPELTAKSVVQYPLRKEEISVLLYSRPQAASFNEQVIIRSVLKESVARHWERMTVQPPADVSLEKLPFFNKEQTDFVIFDLDGTILDSLGAWEHSGTNFLRSLGLEPPAELDAELAQLSLRDGALLIKGKYHLPYTVDEIIEATLRPIRDHYYNDIRVKAKVPALLAHLQKQGIKMAVATAGYEEFARAALSRLGLLDYFKFIITCDEVGVGKRKPRVYEMALVRFGGKKSRTVVVEDAPYALRTAHEAQFRTVGVWDVHHARKINSIQQNANIFVSFD